MQLNFSDRQVAYQSSNLLSTCASDLPNETSAESSARLPPTMDSLPLAVQNATIDVETILNSCLNSWNTPVSVLARHTQRCLVDKFADPQNEGLRLQIGAGAA